MARFRITAPARADIAHILETSQARWGESGRGRYAALLIAVMRAISRAVEGHPTRARAELGRGVRSLHLRDAGDRSTVKEPVHVVFYRVRKNALEILRVLHERMEPTRHVKSPSRRRARRRR